MGTYGGISLVTTAGWTGGAVYPYPSLPAAGIGTGTGNPEIVVLELHGLRGERTGVFLCIS